MRRTLVSDACVPVGVVTNITVREKRSKVDLRASIAVV